MLNYVIYSHTDYLDVLNIQADFLKLEENKILLINKSEWNPIYSKFKDVIFYDDRLPYASRVLALSKLSSELEHIFICQEKDVVIKKDSDIINACHLKMIENNIDRIDLRYDTSAEAPTNEKIYINDNFCLSKQRVGEYVFSLTPSIWKLSSYLKLMGAFSYATYRDIEIVAQQYCKNNFTVYRTYSNKMINCGWIECTDSYTYMPVTHSNRFLPLDTNVLAARMDQDIIQEWLKIVDNFKLNNNPRGFNSVYDCHYE